MKNKRLFTKIALSAFAVLSANAQNDTTVVKFEHDSTMNALDYVLQRPNPSPRFENKRFGDHLWISGAAGADWTRSDAGILGANNKTGFRGGIAVGDWVSPVHGWRLSVEGGRHHGVYDSQPYFIGLSADYMMNMSALLRGDNPNRKFELIGLAGVELEGLHRCHHGLRAAVGLHFGFQPRVYLSPTTFLFVEPRLGVYSDNIDYVKTWHKYDWNASVMVGVGYRMDRLKGFHRDNSLFNNSSFRDNMFLGVSGGMFVTGSKTDNFAHRLGSDMNVFAGKWFSATSGLRLSLGIGDMKRPGIYRRWIAFGDLDYMWNLNSTMNGYDPDRKIEANVLLGVSGMVTNRSDHHLNPAFHVGLQGVWNVTPALGLFLEPSMRIFANRLPGITSDRSNIMTGVNVGLMYRAGARSSRGNASDEFKLTDFLESRRYFIDVEGGIFMRERVWRDNYTVGVALGHWFSPGNAWRVTGEYDYFNKSTNYRSLTLGIDYLGSLTTWACGYNPDRVFDLSAVFGISAGGAHYQSKHNSVVWGPHTGLRAAFSVSPLIDIVLEPSLRAMRIPNSTRKFTPEAHVMAGISFKPQSRRHNTAKGEADIITEDFARNFISLTGGPTLFSETLMARTQHGVSWYGDITAGRWISNVSGLQAGLSYDFIDRRGQDPELNIGTIHADYLMNLTALYSGVPTARFNIIGSAGIGLGWSNRNAGCLSPELNLGLQLRYRIAGNLSIALSPSMAFWRPALSQGRRNNHKFIGVGRIPVGLTYNF